MRELERIRTTQLTGTSFTIDTAARGARGAAIALQPAGAGIVAEFLIDDRYLNIAGGNVNSRVAVWHYDGIDSQQGSYILTPLIGTLLALANNSGGTIESLVVLYDEPPAALQARYTPYFRTNTLAALAVFTGPDFAVGRFPRVRWALTTDRAADIFIDAKTTTAAVYINVATANIAAAGGGTVSFESAHPSPVYRLRVRNNDAALLMTYTVTSYIALPSS
jgi:hypothetical protein